VIDHYIGQSFGNYCLISRIGSGGFATVYQAEHIYLSTRVAVKLLDANLASGDLQNFLAEARTIAHLSHPNIIRIVDFGIEQNIPYLVMEHAPNGTLRQRHPKGTRVPLPLIVRYVRQIASALHYAHTQRLIHRDVKPENLLLGQKNEIQLGDFGAALITRTSLILQTQNVIGTASYMAPEQLQGKPTAASDQYALGIVVYEWLCGRCPFEGSLVELQYQQLYMPAPSLRAQLPTLHPAVEQVVMKALAKQPEQRFATIEAFATALGQASQPVQPASPPLFLPGDAGAHGYGSMLATEVFQAPASRPPVVPVPLPATPLPDTILAAPFRQPAQQRYGRRNFLVGTLAVVAATAIGGGIVFELWQTKSAKTSTHATPVKTPRPTATPVPTKSTPLYTYNHRDQVFTAAWSHDGMYIASAGGSTTGQRQGDTGVHVWQAQTPQRGKDMFTYPGHTKLVRMIAWSPDGTRIASASEDTSVQIWDATTGNKPFVYTGHNGVVRAVAWSPDGKYIASASEDKTVQVWEARNGNNLFSYPNHTDLVTDVAWSPDGSYIASASNDKTVQVWDAMLGTKPRVFPHSTTVGSLAWSPDGRYIVTGDYNRDDSVRIWDWQKPTGSNVLSFSDKPDSSLQSSNPVYTVDWSPDGNYIAAGSNDGVVKVLRVSTGKQVTGELVLIYRGHSDSYPGHTNVYPNYSTAVMSVQWSRDSNTIVSCGFDKTVQIWTM
jgi:eukaryotic-like serine/threonine-protein kinase